MLYLSCSIFTDVKCGLFIKVLSARFLCCQSTLSSLSLMSKSVRRYLETLWASCSPTMFQSVLLFSFLFLFFWGGLFVWFFFFWPCHVAFGILVPWPGVKPVPPAVEAQSLNHRATREVPLNGFNIQFSILFFHFLDSVLWGIKVLNFVGAWYIYFILLLFMLLVSYLRIHC